MINHARTLFLNRQSGVGDIYVPPSYGVLRVPANLNRFRASALTGSDNDEFLLNAVASWMAVLHGPDVEKFALALDNRITYEPTGRKNINTSNTFNLATAASKVVSLSQQMASTGVNGLFYPLIGYEEELLELKELWDNKTRTEERAAAAVYGFIYQMERVRLNG